MASRRNTGIRQYAEEDVGPAPRNSGIASVAPVAGPPVPSTSAAAPVAAAPTGYEDVLRIIQGMQASPVDYSYYTNYNPNDVNPSGPLNAPSVAYGNVPDLAQFYGYDQANNQETVNPAVLQYMKDQGYTIMYGQDPASESSAYWLVGPDGKPIAESARVTGTNDENFKIAAQLAQAVVGGAVGNWAAAGNNTMSGGIGATAAPGATTAPVDVGGLASSTPPQLNMAAIESGLGTPGYGFNAAAEASGLFNPATIGSGANLMYGPNGEIIQNPNAAAPSKPAAKPASEWTDAEWDEYLKNTPDVQSTSVPVGDSVTVTAPGMSTLPGAAAGAGIGAIPAAVDVFTGPGEQTVEVTAPREPPPENEPTVWPGDPFVDSIESNPTNNTNNPQDNQNTPNDGDVDTGQNDPHNDNLDPGGTGPTTPPPITTPAITDKIIDWITKNPKTAITLLGSLIGGGGGSGGGSGGGGGGGTPIVGGTATPAAPLGRRYVAPPPGYRPGFDPEHRYFTGIGATGSMPPPPGPTGPLPPGATPPGATPPGATPPGTPGYVEPLSVGPVRNP